MPTTSKMGIVYPSSSDLVKDGATNMGTIATTVDAKTGLVLITSGSFSASSGVSFAASTFTTNFDSYRLVFVCTGSTTNQTISGRLRVSGADATGSNYNFEDTSFSSTSVGAGRYASQSSWSVGRCESTNPNFTILDLFNPFLASPTGYFASYTEAGMATTSVSFKLTGGGHSLSTSYDSFSFYPQAGTFTGTYSLFGYNK